MNIVTHIFKKDLRHNRVLLIVWLVLLAVRYALIGMHVNPGDEVMQSLYDAISGLTPVLVMLVMIVMIPLLVHDEPLVGTTAFWFTRPISRADLLKSKTLFILLVLTLPPLVGELIVLAANGATGHDLLLAAPEIVMDNLAIVLSVGILAVVTSNIGQFAIAGVGSMLSLILGAMIISWTVSVMRTKDPLADRPAYNATLEHTRVVMCLLSIILAAGAVIAHQYLTRNTVRTIAGILLGLIAVIAVASAWPVDMYKRQPLPVSAPGFDSGPVKVSFNGDVTASDQPDLTSEGPPLKKICAQVRMEGVPPGCILTAQSVHCEVTGSDGYKLKVGQGVMNVDGESDAGALKAALGGTSIIDAPVDEGKSTTRYISFFSLDAETYQRYLNVPLKVSAKVDFVASKYVVTGEIPLTQGAQMDHGRDRDVILNVLNRPGGLNIELRERTFHFMLASDGVAGVIQNGPRAVYLLLNKQRGEAVRAMTWVSRPSGRGVGATRMINETMHISFGRQEYEPEHASEKTPDLTPEWIADATLVRVELKPVAEFTKEFSDDHLSIQAPHSR